jgi:hypothetical protein
LLNLFASKESKNENLKKYLAQEMIQHLEKENKSADDELLEGVTNIFQYLYASVNEEKRIF